MAMPAFTFFLLLFTSTFADLQNQPRIFTNGSNLHIRSGDKGDIVFEPSQQGKVRLGSYELNVAGSAGPPGVKGDKGAKGTIGNTVGTVGNTGEKGDHGNKGDPGAPGEKGEIGPEGQNGGSGPPGPKGASGTPGAPGNPGPKGPEINISPVTYYTDLDKSNEKCNTSSVRILRYSLKGLQLCTKVGWRKIALEDDPPRCSDRNIPEKNLEAFLKGNPGIMFQFNGNIKPLINPSDYNSTIRAELLFSKNNSGTPQGSYVDAVMRQAVYFSGRNFINVSGIPAEFWQDQSWTVTALLKFGEINVKDSVNVSTDMPVLGIGNIDKSHGLRLGIRGSKNRNGQTVYEIIFEHNNNDFHIEIRHVDTWHHITWTSNKTSDNKEERCVQMEPELPRPRCDHKSTDRYRGSALTTIGSFGSFGYEGSVNNLVLDHLIISSGVIDYTITRNEHQLCFAKLVDKNLP